MAAPALRKPAGRRERALATRRSMLRAAYRLFCERGFSGTTMAAIAVEAGVAVQTLYFTFRTKGAILGEVLGAAKVGFDRWPGPVPGSRGEGGPAVEQRCQAWFAEPDPNRALELFLEAETDELQRTAPLSVVLKAAAGDPDAGAAYELARRRRRECFRAFVELLETKVRLRSGLTAASATDIMLAICSGATYQALAARGWSHDACRRFFLDVLGQQLLPEPPERPASEPSPAAQPAKGRTPATKA